MKITLVEPDSIAHELGIQVGDELLEINGRKVLDQIDFRFHESDAVIELKVARGKEVVLYDVEKDEGDRIGIDFEEMKILACGNDCIFCFVDQNPEGLRKELYFRDGDYRLSFMYGNYTTMTNAGPAILDRIIKQRLSPVYISVHVTDYEIRKVLMGLQKDDHILQKIQLLHDNGIDMHTQIVLCPGLNDGNALTKTVTDLYQFNKHIVSLAVVPVGLTDHRFGLHELRKVDAVYARELVARADAWHRRFRKEIGRGFIYPSDEFFLVAGKTIPPSKYYDGFPQTENGVGMVRSFIGAFKRQAGGFPDSVPTKKRMTIATAELPAGFISSDVASRLMKVRGLEITLEIVPNRLYGRNVTVAGLLSGKCLYSALNGKDCGDLLLLPPDVLNHDGVFLDNTSLPQLEEQLGVRIKVFGGDWSDVFSSLNNPQRSSRSQDLLPFLKQHQPV